MLHGGVTDGICSWSSSTKLAGFAQPHSQREKGKGGKGKKGKGEKGKRRKRGKGLPCREPGRAGQGSSHHEPRRAAAPPLPALPAPGQGRDLPRVCRDPREAPSVGVPPDPESPGCSSSASQPSGEEQGNGRGCPGTSWIGPRCEGSSGWEEAPSGGGSKGCPCTGGDARDTQRETEELLCLGAPQPSRSQKGLE